MISIIIISIFYALFWFKGSSSLETSIKIKLNMNINIWTKGLIYILIINKNIYKKNREKCNLKKY